MQVSDYNNDSREFSVESTSYEHCDDNSFREAWISSGGIQYSELHSGTKLEDNGG